MGSHLDHFSIGYSSTKTNAHIKKGGVAIKATSALKIGDVISFELDFGHKYFLIYRNQQVEGI